MKHKEYWEIWCKLAKHTPLLTLGDIDQKGLVSMKMSDSVDRLFKINFPPILTNPPFL